jgi:phosphoribosylformylglycinamidine cyclo-ligase
MNLDDMACVGITDDIILSSTIGRNKNYINGEALAALISASTEFIDEMKEQGVQLHLSGGETADVGDIVRTLDVGYTAFARVPKKDIIDINIQGGDLIVAFASYGQAAWEKEYNGGMGSNGLTSARHDVFAPVYAQKYPESFDAYNMPSDLAYSGSLLLTDIEPESGIPAGKLVLSPTRTYLPLIKKIIAKHRRAIHGIIHCSGGAQTKVLKFVEQKKIVKNNMLPIPPLFKMIQKESGTDPKEMYKVFNMGHRLEIYTKPEAAEGMIALARELGIEAQIIGFVEESDKNELIIESELGRFTYA